MWSRISILRLIYVSISLVVINLGNIATACPTCKNDLQHSGSEFGFAASILFMIATPFCLFAGWTVAIIRLRRKMREEEGALSANVRGS